MPLTESKPDALAMVYARAFYELVDAQGGRDAVEAALGQLEDLLEIARGDASFNEFLASRVVASDARGESLKKILGGNASDTVVNFLLVLNAKDRLSHLPAIVGALDSLVQDAFGRIEVDVFTAEPASPDTLAAVKDKLAAQLGKEIVVHPYTDPTMIGGVKLRIGDQLIDGSLAAKLRQLKGRLGEQGLSSLRAKAGDLIGD